MNSFMHRMPARKPPQNVRLPGPHYMLEQAIAPFDEKTGALQTSKVGAYVLFGQNKQVADDVPAPPEELSNHEQSMTSAEKPNIPVWLATARAREAPAALPSEPAMPQQFHSAPFSPFQHQPGTSSMQMHSPALPPYHHQQQQQQHQYGGQYGMSTAPEPAPRVPSSPYIHQQILQQPHVRHQEFPTLTRSPWRPEGRSSSIQASPHTSNFSQPPLSTQPLHHYPHLVQTPEDQAQPNMPAYFQEQPPLGPPTSYEASSPDRSALERQPPDSHNGENSHYWQHADQASFRLPSRPDSAPLVYDRARGAAASTQTVQLPSPRDLTAPLATGYYVRAAGTLQRYPAGLIRP